MRLLIHKLTCSVKIIDVSVRCSCHTIWHTAWHTAWHSAWSTTGSLIDLHHDWIVLSFELFLLGFILFSAGVLVALKELKALSRGIFDDLFVLIRELVLKLLITQGVFHLEAIVFESILGINLLSELVILVLILLSILHHFLDLLLREATFVVGDGNLLGLSSGLVTGRDIEDTVGINIEGDFNLWGSTRRWWDSFEVELSKQVIVLGHLTLTLKDLNVDTWLVVSICGESLLLFGWDGGVPWNKDS